MSIYVTLKKSKNPTKSSFGKYYAKTVPVGEVHTHDMAEYICANATFKVSEVEGILTEVAEYMTHQLQEGQVVVLDGFGRFRLVAESEGVDHPRQFSLSRHIKRVVCKFLPAGRRHPQTGEITRDFCKGVSVKFLPEE